MRGSPRNASTSRCRAPEAPRGTVHPVSQVKDEVTAIFADLGLRASPKVRTSNRDDYNFTKLNIPPEHPARQMHDTFYLKPQADGSRPLLRTHTSPVQVRTMLAQKPPIRIIAPGRTYRLDSDATHSPMFHQVEALVIDEETHLGHLKWLIEEFCKAFFEVSTDRDPVAAVATFPFTEPSMEVDIQCDRSGGHAQDSARARTGSRSAAPAWCIRACSRCAASIPRAIRASPSASGSTAWRC